MKKALLLFAALLVAGCGEKSSSEGSESASEKPATEPSADTPKPPPAETPVAESPVADSPSEEPSDTPKSLSDADVERLLKEAIDIEPLEEPDDLHYQNNEPFSGWGKMMYDSGQVRGLVQLKDGKMTGLMTAWHENGQKMHEGTYKDGKEDGRATMWHENGQKQAEATFKDGEEVSGKYWNSKGEEVETHQKSRK